ncbi:MAG TPA: hypothetical protein VHX17_10895 [Candidatus Cybelea sp.]|jgi:hypothetical protein|nr:hypothetical protein [Candidatus Cybelea sp.]
MTISTRTKQISLVAMWAALLAACSAGAPSSFGIPAATRGQTSSTARIALPQAIRERGRHPMRPDRCAGNRLYFSDLTNSVIDSFGASGGAGACTVTTNGISNPLGIWENPTAGTYYEDLFVANAGNGTAVAFKTPMSNTSKPIWQFKVGSAASDVVQDRSGNVYVAVYGTPNIAVFKPPFDSCSYPGACSASYTITDPCGTVYWLATEGKGDVYSNNYCGYVSLFVAPIAPGAVGTPLSGVSFGEPGGMLVDNKFELVVNDPGTRKVSVYGLSPEEDEATFRYALTPYSGAIAGIGLDQADKFLWGANVTATQGQQYRFTSGGRMTSATATDPTLVTPMGAAARPSGGD